GIVISEKHVAMHVIDDEETLILEEESRSKMSKKEKDPEAVKQNISHKPIDYEKLNRLNEDFGKCFTPQQELSAEQAFWLRIYNPTIESSFTSPVKVEVTSKVHKKAQWMKPTLYDGIVISEKHVAMHVIDDEETLILEEESRSKMSKKEKDPEAVKQNISHKPIDYEKLNRLNEDFGKYFGKRFIPQQELSTEQGFWFQMLNPSIDCFDASPVKVDVPSELPKLDLVPLDPMVKNNRESHIYYLRHTMEQDAILKEIVEQAKSLNPLDSASYSACMYVKLIQELLGVKPSTSASGSKPLGNTKNDRILRLQSSNEKNKVEVQSRQVKSSLNTKKSDSKNVYNKHVKHPVTGCPDCSLFYDSDLEVAFRKHTCFVCNLEGVDLLSGYRGTNLYYLSIGDMMAFLQFVSYQKP
nr:integrase, catalytic region, zinc finger, CCHC-type, peptidase aspartic, catalytic [Tanacetum cinerariifolium]